MAEFEPIYFIGKEREGKGWVRRFLFLTREKDAIWNHSLSPVLTLGEEWRLQLRWLFPKFRR